MTLKVAILALGQPNKTEKVVDSAVGRRADGKAKRTARKYP